MRSNPDNPTPKSWIIQMGFFGSMTIIFYNLLGEMEKMIQLHSIRHKGFLQSLIRNI